MDGVEVGETAVFLKAGITMREKMVFVGLGFVVVVILFQSGILSGLNFGGGLVPFDPNKLSCVAMIGDDGEFYCDPRFYKRTAKCESSTLTDGRRGCLRTDLEPIQKQCVNWMGVEIGHVTLGS